MSPALLQAMLFITIETAFLACHLSLKQLRLPLNLNVHCKVLSNIVTMQILIQQVCGRGLPACTSNWLPGEAGVVGPGTTSPVARGQGAT